jgi:8-oxo-dGTP pyrophosphatase MutT (NUDIX family)
METLIRDRLGSRRKVRLPPGDRIPAAVLIPLYHADDAWHIVFIRRTETVSTHKGQISFPGGSRDVEDADLLTTALREACEEIGLRPEDAEVLGELDDEFTATSNYVVTPFVGKIPWPYAFTRCEDEVAEILTVPLGILLDGSARRGDVELWHGREIPPPTYHQGDYVIWGATALILEKFLAILNDGGANGS